MPVEYSDQLAAEVCDRIANGQSLREIARADGMPGKSTFLRWVAERPALRDQYAHAMDARADHFGEEILEIADDASNDWMVRNKGQDDEAVVPNHDHIARSRLRVDSRKWLMSKLAPKKYGDKLDLEHSGRVEVTKVVRTIVDPSQPPNR